MNSALRVVFVAMVFIGQICTGMCADEAEPIFGVLDAPKSDSWLMPERWKDETLEGKPAVRLMAGASYAQLKVTGAVPTDGKVMLRIRYYNSGTAVTAGIGAWGSPCVQGEALPKGWQTEELLFPASAIAPFLKDGKIALVFLGGSAAGTAIGHVEMFVPTSERIKARYIKWVKEGTDSAFEIGKKLPFEEIKNDEPVIPVNASAEDTARGFIPFVRSYVQYICPSSIPKPAERIVAGQVVLPPGEFDNFQFAVYALKELSQMSAEVEGALPEGLHVDLRWVECAPLRFGASSAKKFKISPNRLWPKDIFPTCDVKKGESRAWYAIVKTDSTLAAQDYPVKIALKSEGKSVQTYTLTVKVLPFTLPKTRDMKKLFLVTDTVLIDDDPTLKDMEEHGLNATSVFDGCQPVLDKKANFMAWDANFAKLKKYHLDAGFFWYLGNPKSGNAVKGGVGAEQFDLIVQGLNERVKDGRYPKNFFLSIDEAVLKGGAFAQFKELFQYCKTKAPELRMLGCSLDKFTNTVQYEGVTDMLACNGSFAEDSKWCKEKNVLLNIYSSACASFSSAGDSRLRYGFFTYQYGSYAMNGWAFQWHNGHPFNGLDTGITDWASIFPNWTGGTPISSPCWEGIRQGINDQRYLAVLEELVKAGKSDGKLLEDIRTNGVGTVSLMKEVVIGDTNFGATMSNASDLEIARARIIQEILTAMGKK